LIAKVKEQITTKYRRMTGTCDRDVRDPVVSYSNEDADSDSDSDSDSEFKKSLMSLAADCFSKYREERRSISAAPSLPVSLSVSAAAPPTSAPASSETATQAASPPSFPVGSSGRGEAVPPSLPVQVP